MKRHATHLDRLALMGAAFGQGDVQGFRGSYRIRKEHLEEIAHAVEQDRAGIAGLDLQILRHHRRCGVVGHGGPQIARHNKASWRGKWNLCCGV